MRALLLSGGLLTLAGCAGLPQPDPTQAWIDLTPHAKDTALQALEVDDKATLDKRYFEVPPAAMS